MLRSIRTSIATVSISGTLVEKLNAIRAAGFDGVEIFENDLLYFDGTPADVRRMREDLGLDDHAVSAVSRFRRCERGAARSAMLDRAKRKFDVMHELGTDRMLVCSNVSPDTIGDDALMTDQLGALARAAEAAGVIAGYEALAWGDHVKTVPARVEARERRESSQSRARARQLSHAVARRHGGRDRRHSGRPHRLRADRRRAEARHGRARMEPPLPLLPGPRRFRSGQLHGAGRENGLQRAAFAGNFQRRLSRRPHHRSRPRTAIARCCSSRNRPARCSKPRRQPVGDPVSLARGARARRLSVSRVRGGPHHARATRRLARQTALSRGGPASLEGSHAVSARRGVDRAERRAGFVRQRVLPAAWLVAVRVGVSRRRRQSGVRARRRLRLRAVFRADRPERARAARRAGAGQQPELFRRRNAGSAHLVRGRFRPHRHQRSDRSGAA